MCRIAARQTHMPQDCRVHYAITDTGGRAANVVQASAEVLYLIRAPDMPQALELAGRVEKVARGAAMMTETEVEIVFDTASTNLLPNITLETAMHENMVALGPIAFDEADIAFARKIQATFTEEAIRSSIRLCQIKGDVFSNAKVDGSTPLHTGLRHFEGQSHFRAGSTDVGDVSWVTPTAQCWAPAWAIGTNPHTWQVVAQGKKPGRAQGHGTCGQDACDNGARIDVVTRPPGSRDGRVARKDQRQSLYMSDSRQCDARNGSWPIVPVSVCCDSDLHRTRLQDPMKKH